MASLNRKGQVVVDESPVRVEVIRPCWLKDLDQGGAMRACSVGEVVRITRSDYEDGGQYKNRLAK